MNWVAIIWAVSSGASLMLGVMQLFIWFKSNRQAKEHLALAFTAFAVPGVALCEWLMMTVQDPRRYANFVQWTHAPGFVLLAGIVAFVWYHFRTGTAWLAWAVIGLRGLVLALNFLIPESIGFKEITALKQISFLGQHVSVVAEAVSNPLNRFAEVSALVFVVYVADASFRLWRRGGPGARRKAVLVGGGILFFLVLAAVHSSLVHARVIHSPYIISLAFFGIVLPMAHELSHDVLESARLSRSLRQAEQVAFDASVGKRRAEERTALVVEAAPNAMIMVDSSSRMLLVNRQAEHTFGYTRDEMLGKPLEMLIPARFGAHYATRIARYFERPENRAMDSVRDLFGLKKDGSEVPVEVGLNSVETAGERFVLASVVEITERLRMEKEVAEHRAELMHLSRVSLLGQLSGSLAHELNQPLAIILSNAEAAEHLLEEGGSVDVEELKEIMKDIISENLRAGEVIKSLRALLKRGTLRQLPLSLNDVVRDAIRLTRSDLTGRGIAVVSESSDSLPLVQGDTVQLQQVVINLIMNACDAMSETAPDQRVLRLVTSLNGSAVRLSCHDRGCGLPEGGAAAAFRSFFTTKQQGLGLGLSICQSIVAAHQGRIWCETPGEGGTVFHMELPGYTPPQHEL